MQNNISVIFNTAAQLFAKAISVSSNALVMILILRGYGVTGAGEYTKALSYIALFYFLCDFGLNAIAVRIATEGKKTHIFSHLLIVRLAGSVILTFIALAILPFLPYDASTGIGYSPLTTGAIIVLTPTILLYAVQLSMNAFFQYSERFDKAAIATSIGSITSLSLFYIAVVFHWPFILAMIAYCVGYAVVASLSWMFSRLPLAFPSRGEWTTLLIGALPLGAILFLNLIYSKGDIFILTSYRSTQEVGYYGLAYKVFEVLLTIPTFFANSFYPVLLRLLNAKDAALHNQINKSAKLLLAASIVICIVGFTLENYLGFIDPAFTNAIPLLRILLLSLPFFFLSSLYQWLMIATKQYWALLSVYTIAMIIGISANLFFVPQYGATSSAIITCVVELLVFLCTYYLSTQFLRAYSNRHTV